MTANNDNFLSYDDVETWLAGTEHLGSLQLKMDGTDGLAVFALNPGWNVGLKDKDDQEVVSAQMEYKGTTYDLTKEAALSIAHSVGLPPAYVMRTPGILISTHLNYWAKSSPDSDMRLLTSAGNRVLTATKGGIVPFSNMKLLDIAMDPIFDRREEAEVLFDVLSHHNVHSTALRIVDTSETVEIAGDEWEVGLQMMNSLTGKHPLTMGLYLRNRTVGAGLVVYGASSRYNRKTMGQDFQEVLHWVRQTGEELLQDVSHEFEILESLKSESIADSVTPVLTDIFKTYKVPLKVRQTIMDTILETKDLTYYGVVSALLQAASEEDLRDHYRTNLMEIAGAVMHDVSHRCNSCKRVV